MSSEGIQIAPAKAAPPPPPKKKKEDALEPGTILAGRYKVIDFLGHGGMGAVYRAHHMHLDQEVALKTLVAALAGNSQATERFLREARTCMKIRHRNAVGVLDLDRDAASGQLFMVMDLCKGKPLDSVLKERGALPPNVATPIAMQVLDALAESHRQGIIHRDIKPNNILVNLDGPEPEVKVLDFGIARAISNAAKSEIGHTLVTGPGVLIGTPGYMSPQQAAGMDLDARTDIFSTGIVLYEMLAGRRPWEAPDRVRLAGAVASEPPYPLLQAAPATPRALVAIVEKSLAKLPEDRYQTTEDFRNALANPAPADPMAAWRASGAVAVPQLDLGLRKSSGMLAVPPGGGSSSGEHRLGGAWRASQPAMAAPQLGGALAADRWPATPMNLDAGLGKAPTPAGLPAAPPKPVLDFDMGLPKSPASSPALPAANFALSPSPLAAAPGGAPGPMLSNPAFAVPSLPPGPSSSPSIPVFSAKSTMPDMKFGKTGSAADGDFWNIDRVDAPEGPSAKTINPAASSSGTHKVPSAAPSKPRERKATVVGMQVKLPEARGRKRRGEGSLWVVALSVLFLFSAVAVGMLAQRHEEMVLGAIFATCLVMGAFIAKKRWFGVGLSMVLNVAVVILVGFGGFSLYVLADENQAEFSRNLAKSQDWLKQTYNGLWQEAEKPPYADFLGEILTLQSSVDNADPHNGKSFVLTVGANGVGKLKLGGNDIPVTVTVLDQESFRFASEGTNAVGYEVQVVYPSSKASFLKVLRRLKGESWENEILPASLVR